MSIWALFYTLSLSPCLSLSFPVSRFLPVCLSSSPSFSLPPCLSLFLPVCLSSCLLPPGLSLFLPVCLSSSLSVSLPPHLSLFLPVYLSSSLSVSLPPCFLPVCLSSSLSVSLSPSPSLCSDSTTIAPGNKLENQMKLSPTLTQTTHVVHRNQPEPPMDSIDLSQFLNVKCGPMVGWDMIWKAAEYSQCLGCLETCWQRLKTHQKNTFI